MTLHGTFRSGVVVLEGGAALPEGMLVTVLVEQNQAETPPEHGKRMTEEEHRSVRAILDKIAALPNEKPRDTFSGRDHDQVLHGEP